MTETIACPFCQETIPAAALICGKCQAVLVSVEWRTFANSFRWASPSDRARSLRKMSEADKARFPAVWDALRMGPWPLVDVRSEEEMAASEASARRLKRILVTATLVIVIGMCAALVMKAMGYEFYWPL